VSPPDLPPGGGGAQGPGGCIFFTAPNFFLAFFCFFGQKLTPQKWVPRDPLPPGGGARGLVGGSGPPRSKKTQDPKGRLPRKHMLIPSERRNVPEDWCV
jgi:hypothetical protein